MKPLYFIWSFIERFGANVLSFAGNIALAYMLSPDDFGLMAMLSLFTGLIVILVDAGTGDALLQRGSPSRRDFNTVFYFNVAVAIVLSLTYVVISPLVAQFYHKPELRLMMSALGVGALFYGLSVTQFTRLRSQLKFRTVAVINLAAVVIALCAAIYVAASGGRYWALVTLQTGHPAASFLLLLVFSRWELRLEFDFKRFKQIWQFSVNLLISTFFNLLSQYVLPMILGWKYNATQAGFMGQAQKLQQTPVNSVEVAMSLTSFVVISKEDDRVVKTEQVKRMFNVMTLINTLFCVMIIALARPIIEVIFPERWLPVIPYLRLLAIWSLVYPVCNHAMVIFKVFNHTSVIRNVFIFEKSAIVIAALSLSGLGVTAIIVAATILSVISLVVYLYMAGKVIGRANAYALAERYVINLSLGALAGCIAFGLVYVTYYLLGDGAVVSATALILGLSPFIAIAVYRYQSLRSIFQQS